LRIWSDGISRLNRVRPITRGFVAHSSKVSDKKPQEMKAQVEVLRKMLLAMVEDIRVVLLRLASRTQTLRYYAVEPDPNCAWRWRARRWNCIRRWPTGSASGS
jgi:(p)ppGpp synthase/HD superfamily hydrolase